MDSHFFLPVAGSLTRRFSADGKIEDDRLLAKPGWYTRDPLLPLVCGQQLPSAGKALWGRHLFSTTA